jgi:hypothetical protein
MQTRRRRNAKRGGGPGKIDQKTIGAYTVGPAYLKADANYAETPDMFSSPFAKVSGHGCAGTMCNDAAARGEYISYKKMIGGRKLMASCGQGSNSLPAPITGPKSGHGNFCSYDNGAAPNAQDLKGGRLRRNARKTKRRGGKKSAKRTASKRHGRSKKRTHKRGRAGRRKHRGGYSVPGSNVPFSLAYSLGAPLPNMESALANPPPQHAYDHCAPIKRS